MIPGIREHKFVRNVYTDDVRIEQPYYNDTKLKKWYNDNTLVWADLLDTYVCFASKNNVSYDSIFSWTWEDFAKQASAPNGLRNRYQNAKGYMKIISDYDEKPSDYLLYFLAQNGSSRQSIRTNFQPADVCSLEDGFLYLTADKTKIVSVTLGEYGGYIYPQSERIIYQSSNTMSFLQNTGGNYGVYINGYTVKNNAVDYSLIFANKDSASEKILSIPYKTTSHYLNFYNFGNANNTFFCSYAENNVLVYDTPSQGHYETQVYCMLSSSGDGWTEPILIDTLRRAKDSTVTPTVSDIMILYNTDNGTYYAIVSVNISSARSYKIYASSNLHSWSEIEIADSVSIKELNNSADDLVLRNKYPTNWNVSNITIYADAFYVDSQKVIGGTPALTLRLNDDFIYMPDFTFSDPEGAYYIKDAFRSDF